MLWSGDGVSDNENHWKCTETLYGASFYISMKDCAKLGSQLGSRKLSNIYVSLSEVVWEWIVVPLQSNGQKTRCARQDHCLCIPSLEAGTRIMTDCLITHFYRDVLESIPRFAQFDEDINLAIVLRVSV